jgi:hypothetical protein
VQPVIHVSADGLHAWTRSRALNETGTFGKTGHWGDDVYENELVKENGVWKLKKNHIYTTFIASYDAGWKTDGAPTPQASEKIPPDRPPTEVYESFPKVYVPPYHYKNPVTGGEPTTLEPFRIERLKTIAATVERLEDERAIENLQRIYGFYMDKGLWQDAADLFADNGTLEFGGGGVFVGKASVHHYLSGLAPHGLTRGLLFNHLLLQPIVTIAADGKTAKGRWHYLAETGEYERFATWGLGVDENEYVKDNGVWKIKTLHRYLRMYTPYEDGWGKKAFPNTQPEKKDMAPDKPPTITYDIYPATFVPPYHYKNPVTLR